MKYDNEFQFRIIAPTIPLQSPDISAPVGNHCTKPKKGDSPFFSKQRPNFLDVNTKGENEAVTAGQLKRRLLENSKKVKSLKSPGNSGGLGNSSSFIVTIKNGKITKMTDGNNQKVSFKGYKASILGLRGKSDGVYRV